MVSGRYSIVFDRTGFPLVQRYDWRHAISLFPVSKVQFERFLVESGPWGHFYTDAWYRELLTLNPRAPWQRYTLRPWELFLTGLDAEARAPFLRYLGRDFRLPTVAEWRALLAVEEELRTMRAQFLERCPEAPAPVRAWVEHELFPLCREGLLEAVQEGDGRLCFIGRPYPALLPNTWRPESVREVDWELAKKAVGFRVVRWEQH